MLKHFTRILFFTYEFEEFFTDIISERKYVNLLFTILSLY